MAAHTGGDDRRHRAAFPTTRITLLQAATGAGPHAREALSTVCHSYWYPIYAYVRRLGYQPQEAEDLTQGFFARVLEKDYLLGFDRDRGRFRSFLLGALKHFISHERDWTRALKRGGPYSPLPLDDALDGAESRYHVEPADDRTPDKVFERQWALAVLARVQDQLQQEVSRQGKARQFERLKERLVGEETQAGYRTLAQELGTSEGALKVAVHRLRQRFRDLLREEIRQTVANPSEVGDELRFLLSAIRG